MDTTKNTIAAGEFKARCLALLDSVAATGRAITVTKHGKPVARLVPLEPPKTDSLQGSIVAQGDLVSPTGETWSADE